VLITPPDWAFSSTSSRSAGRRSVSFSAKSDDYWAPVGVWQVRESVRNAFEGQYGEAETFHEAVSEVATRLPVSYARLRRKSELAAGLQSNLSAFSSVD